MAKQFARFSGRLRRAVPGGQQRCAQRPAFPEPAPDLEQQGGDGTAEDDNLDDLDRVADVALEGGIVEVRLANIGEDAAGEGQANDEGGPDAVGARRGALGRCAGFLAAPGRSLAMGACSSSEQRLVIGSPLREELLPEAHSSRIGPTR